MQDQAERTTASDLLAEMAQLSGRLMTAARGGDRRVAAAMSSASAAVTAARARLGCDLLMVDVTEASSVVATIEVNGLIIDKTRRTVTRAGRLVRLTPTMFDVLWLLAGDPSRVFTKEEIYKAIWRDEHLPASALRTVESHVGRLRVALGGQPWVHTHWGVGVSLLPPEMAVAA